MTIKRSKLSIAVAVATALTAGQAFALSPTTTPDIEIWMSGASAEDGMIGALFTDLCQTGTLDTYLSDDGSKFGASHRAFFCTLDSTKVAGLSVTNPKVLFHKRSAGGSGMGVAPVADATPIAHMSITNGNCTLAATNEYHCTVTGAGDTINHVSDGGISDVEPALFVPPNVPSGFSATTPAQLAKLNIQSQVGLVFGIPVTTALRDALQAAEGLTVGAEDEANMPSLSREQVVALMTGGITQWSQLKVNGTSLTAVAGVTPPTSDSIVIPPFNAPLVHICRRVEGSGTQAQMNANFLRVPCLPGAAQPVTATNPATGPVVTLNSGSGDVDVCLDGENTANHWALGLQSTEKNNYDPVAYPPTGYKYGYRFIKVDGKAPTLANAASNQYFDWAENSIQWLKAANGGPTGDKLVILNKIATDAGKPSIVKNVNTKFVYSWGQAGYMSLNTNGWTPTTPFDLNNPVATATHVLGGGVNNCRVPLINSGSELF
jgi:hypothetical protein